MDDLESKVMARWQGECERLNPRQSLIESILRRAKLTPQLSDGSTRKLLSMLRLDTLRRLEEDVKISRRFNQMASLISAETSQTAEPFTSRANAYLEAKKARRKYSSYLKDAELEQ